MSSRRILAGVLTGAGAVAIVAGAAWVAVPLGVIAAGVLILLAGLFLVDVGPRRP